VQCVTAEDPAGELESDGQVMHVEIDVALTPVEYVDALQSMQSDSASLLSVLRYVPGGQLRHVVTDGEPWMTEYLPAAHAMQSDSSSLLSVSRYFPGGQSRHVETDDEPLMTEYLPAAHAVQLADPVDSLCFPATHAVHVSPLETVKPALQAQFVKTVLPAGELEFDGHVVQVEVADALTAAEYVPAPHLVHTVAAVAVEYVPDPQSVQLADPVDVLTVPAKHAVHEPPSDPQ
jgi:hypothetical protein